MPGATQARRGGDFAFGGGVRRPALAPLPNYMRPTTCSGAKAGAASLKEEAEAPPPPTTTTRGKLEVAGAPPPHVGRATCSSTLKGAPREEEPAAHVCSYAYCSLKGHVRAPPLRTFVASRRRLVKTQHSMKLKGASPFRKPSNNNSQGGGAEGYFVEIHNAADPLSSTEEMVEYDCLSCGDDKAKDYSVGDSCGSVVSDGSIELLGSTENRGRIASQCCDHQDHDYFGACNSDISDETNFPQDVGGDQYYAPKEYSSDGISSALSGISFEDVTSSECADAVTSQRNKLHVSGRRRTMSEEGSKQTRPFKPRPPNFLPVVETGPEAEKVDLRHQAANDPRDAEEWMVDYALRKAVKKLARAQKRKVEMLVQAFETVLPTVASDKQPVQHGDDKTNSFAISRPSQACT